MILQMARASPLPFTEFAILFAMSKTDAHILDPIPDEQYLEARDATGGKPAGVRFLAFNTIIDIEAYGEAAACRAAFEEARARCRLYERLFSRTLPHSDIARINSAHGQPVAIDPLTYDLLERALSYCAESEGAFDITVGPAVRLWNFHEGTVPNDGALAEAVHHVDWHALRLRKTPAATAAESDADAATEAVPGFEAAPEPKACFAQLADPDAAVDAGGIAKGWIADALVAAMEAHGLSGIIVNLGGNVAVSGTKPTGDPWRVGIRDPRDPSQLIGAVPLVAGSAVTSGVYERCFTAPDGTSTTISSIRARGAPSKPTWPASPSSARNPSTRRASLPPCSPSASNADSPSPVDTPKFCRPSSSPPTAPSPQPAERAMKSLYRGEIVASSNRRRTLD